MSPESKALMDSETSCSRSARLVAVTMTSPRPVTSAGCFLRLAAAFADTARTAEMAVESACGPVRVPAERFE